MSKHVSGSGGRPPESRDRNVQQQQGQMGTHKVHWIYNIPLLGSLFSLFFPPAPKPPTQQRTSPPLARKKVRKGPPENPNADRSSAKTVRVATLPPEQERFYVPRQGLSSQNVEMDLVMANTAGQAIKQTDIPKYLSALGGESDRGINKRVSALNFETTLPQRFEDAQSSVRKLSILKADVALRKTMLSKIDEYESIPQLKNSLPGEQERALLDKMEENVDRRIEQLSTKDIRAKQAELTEKVENFELTIADSLPQQEAKVLAENLGIETEDQASFPQILQSIDVDLKGKKEELNEKLNNVIPGTNVENIESKINDLRIQTRGPTALQKEIQDVKAKQKREYAQTGRELQEVVDQSYRAAIKVIRDEQIDETLASLKEEYKTAVDKKSKKIRGLFYSGESPTSIQTKIVALESRRGDVMQAVKEATESMVQHQTRSQTIDEEIDAKYASRKVDDDKLLAKNKEKLQGLEVYQNQAKQVRDNEKEFQTILNAQNEASKRTVSQYAPLFSAMDAIVQRDLVEAQIAHPELKPAAFLAQNRSQNIEKIKGWLSGQGVLMGSDQVEKMYDSLSKIDFWEASDTPES